MTLLFSNFTHNCCFSPSPLQNNNNNTADSCLAWLTSSCICLTVWTPAWRTPVWDSGAGWGSLWRGGWSCSWSAPAVTLLLSPHRDWDWRSAPCCLPALWRHGTAVPSLPLQCWPVTGAGRTLIITQILLFSQIKYFGNCFFLFIYKYFHILDKHFPFDIHSTLYTLYETKPQDGFYINVVSYLICVE